jgi:hypothetical protein
MLETISKKSMLIGSLVLMSVMFTIVMFFVNPQIDGSDGIGIIKLQLSFSKEAGIGIIYGWGESGIAHFKQWIFTDYIYAFSYSVFFASLLSMLILKKGKSKSPAYTWVVYLAFVAGVFDWIENTMELFFLNNPTNFPNTLFFIHSIIATLKWSAVPIAVAYIVILLTKKNAIQT